VRREFSLVSTPSCLHAIIALTIVFTNAHDTRYSSFYAQRMRDQQRPRFSAVVGAGMSEEEVPLPANWDERYDVDGRKFYVDHNKKRTTWVHPVTGKKSKRLDTYVASHLTCNLWLKLL
jgi:hypothetical protein